MSDLEDMYGANEQERRNELLKDMSSVMMRNPKEDSEIKSINERMMKHATAIDNLLRENKVLRHKNTSLIKDNKTLINKINMMDNDINLLREVLIEQSKRIDYLENNVIIKK